VRPAIQYVASADGTTLAYRVEGEGPPLLHVRPGATHLELDREVTSYRTQVDVLRRHFRVVMADTRGMGLSQRGPVEHSLARWVDDIEAVTSRLGDEPIAIVALGWGAATAVAYAHRWPARVSRLVLWNPLLCARDGSSELRSLGNLIATNWNMYTEMIADLLYGWADSAAARGRAAAMRAASTPEETLAVQAVQATIDVNGLLPDLVMPALVLLPRDAVLAMGEGACRVAATMPNAELVTIPGKYIATDFRKPELLEPVARFLGIPVERVLDVATPGHEAVVILFADVVDSTALTERVGDAAYRTRAADLDLRLRATLRTHGGTPIDGRLLGDGVLATFRSGRDAIDAARACHGDAAAVDLALHVGLHAGDVIRDQDDVHGGAVNLAARVAALAGAGETLVTETLRGVARTSAGVPFDERGVHALKGIEEPQRLFAVR
jgi:class 3 adenylate cyclase